MEPARSIGRLGFSKWYERRLIEAHAWLLTGLLCAIYVGVSLEGLSFKGNALVWLGTTGGTFVGGLIVWHALRRFFAILGEAERLSRQSTCSACKAYARFEVIRAQSRIGVRCRRCGNEWTMS
ncbi:MAG: hypothetical protein IT514_08110 [Burkholderiales bacterium]|nr:hypothetical protein [Burkholderiales bacterium]